MMGPYCLDKFSFFQLRSYPAEPPVFLARPRHFSPEENLEIQMGEKEWQRLKGVFTERNIPIDSSSDASLLLRISRIGEKIAARSDYPRFPYQFHIIDSPRRNAFSLPGGHIALHRGLWSQEAPELPYTGLACYLSPSPVDLSDDSDLAVALSHEIGHVAAHHVKLLLDQSPDGFLPETSDEARQFEFDADRLGMIYLAKAGYDPRIAIRYWKNNPMPESSSTSLKAHPSHAERVQSLEESLSEALAFHN